MKKTLLLGSAFGAFASTLAFSAPVLAQDSDEIVIKAGTRRAARTATDSPVPVDVIGGDEFVNSGDSDLSNLLRTSVPSYNVNTQPISDAATLVRPANLRGLAPDHTLVLVNGKRRHRSAVISFLGGGISDGAQGPDISVIPALALKQVEVLRDGAASQYGSDAIAGVINFVLKDAPTGGQAEVKWGQTYEGDGDQYQIAANIGLPIGPAGYLNLTGEFSQVDATDRSVQRDDAAALIAAGNTFVNDPAQIWGQPNVNDDIKLFANFGYELSESAEVYAFGNYAEREVEGGFFFRNPNNRGGVNSNDGGATLLVGDLTADGSGACPVVTITNNVIDPVGLQQLIDDPDCFAFNELEPGGFTPRFGGNLEDLSFVAGIRGELGIGGGLNYDVSGSFGRNTVDFFINNTINASLGPNTPRSFQPGGYEQEDINFNLDLSYAVEGTPLAALTVSGGFEYREESFTINQGDDASFELGPLAAPSVAFPTGQGFSSSSNGFGGFVPASAGENSQDNTALYLDIEADVTESFFVQAAVRYEDFSTFGDTTNYKIASRWNATDNVTFRGSFSTGFKAPTVGQANVSNVTTQFIGGVLTDTGTLPLSSAAGQFIADFVESQPGATRPTLGPEESESFTVGAAFNLGAAKFTIDFYNVEITDRISISEQQSFFGALVETADNNTVDVTGLTTPGQLLFALDAAGVLAATDFAGSEDLSSFGFFNNDYDTETTGVDFVLTSPLDWTADGNTNISVALNYNDTEVTRRGNLGDTRLRQLEENLPKWRGNVTLTHDQGPWRALGRMNYYGEFFEAHLDSGDLPINAGSEITFDAELGYTFGENLELIAGARNIFDSFPDENPFSGVAGSVFPATAPGGYNGGSYYLKARYTW